MLWKNITILLIIMAISICHATKAMQAKMDVQQMLDGLYSEISGYLIDIHDRDRVEQNGGNATYGEITFSGVQKLLAHLHLTEHDIFYDLGCGVGKMVMQVYLTSPVKKSVGIELSQERFASAERAKQLILEVETLEPGRTFEFIHGDILTANIHEATAIYLASTCFSDDFMQRITEKFITQTPASIRIVTLRELPANNAFVLSETLELPMTWSDHTPVYVYRRK
ncbi:MAG TPA: hypothetical protein VEK38_00570 [Candidatus Bathyarchaeia archaeon]|nr:hypothetical protein [Candidatus Bathyarchaeia archaeon]